MSDSEFRPENGSDEPFSDRNSHEFRQPISESVYHQNYQYGPDSESWPDTAKRVVTTLLEQDKDQAWYTKVRDQALDALTNRRALPGGRVIANAGTDYDNATLINCLAGETKVLTRSGRKEIENLAGETHTLLTENGKWVDVPVKSFGKQPLRKITLKRNGVEKEIFATPNHEWVVTTKKKDGHFRVETDELRGSENWSRSVQHKLKSVHARAKTSAKISNVGIARGFAFGDGSQEGDTGSACVAIVEDKIADLEKYYTPHFSFSTFDHAENEDLDVVKFSGLPTKWTEEVIDIDENSSTLYGWLAGYFAADGCVTENGTPIMDSCTKENIEHFIDILEVLGIDHYGIKFQDRISNITGEPSRRYYVRINPEYLREGFFVREKHRKRFVENGSRELTYRWKVKSVERTNRVEEVFCAEVPDTHTFALENGILTSNCFVSGSNESDPDSIEGIMAELDRCARILASEGGYGFCADFMRPRSSIISGTGARTPGAVEMLNLWDQTSETLTKGPETEAERDDAKNKIRKGAMMVTMSVWHPDVQEFVTAKQEAGRLSKFNMSVLVSDAFMNAVENGEDWELVFPDYEAVPEKYKREWQGKLSEWDGPVKTYDVVSARELYDTIMESTYKRNEPGVLFVDTINERNPMYYKEQIKATNACSEWPMPPGGACNLTNLVLPRYLRDDNSIDWGLMRNDIEAAVIMADNVNDIAYVPTERQERELQEKRRVGLGHMGFGSLCAMKGIEYGSDESVDLASKIQQTVTNTAYFTSALLARDKEPFPAFDYEQYKDGDMYQRLDSDVQTLIKQFGLRNSHLTSIQPTGNTSVLAGNVSSGIEPIFMAEYTRTAEQPHLPDGIDYPEIGEADEHGYTDEVRNTYWDIEKQGDETVWRCTKDGYQAWQIHPTRGIVKDEPVRDFAVEVGNVDPSEVTTTRDLSVSDHVRVLDAFAEYVDSSISKTINLPADYPFDDFKDLYKEMWETGRIKGGTTYREGSMSAVLKSNEEDDSSETAYKDECCPECNSENIVYEEGCVTCLDCEYAGCEL